MNITSKAKNTIFQLSAILILLAAIAYAINTEVAKYVMIIGVLGFAYTTFTTPYPGKNIRGKRLFNYQIFTVILMGVSAYLMYVDLMAWVVVLLISAVLTIYCTLMLDYVYRKEQKDGKDLK